MPESPTSTNASPKDRSIVGGGASTPRRKTLQLRICFGEIEICEARAVEGAGPYKALPEDLRKL